MAMTPYDRGGIVTNLDLSLSEKDLEKGVKLEEHVEVLDRFLDKTDGTYGFQGVVGSNSNITIPKGKVGRGERIDRVRARINSGNPPLMVAYDGDTDTPIFMDEDQEAYEDGYICGSCYQYQAVPHAPSCNYTRSPLEGCGHSNY